MRGGCPLLQRLPHGMHGPERGPCRIHCRSCPRSLPCCDGRMTGLQKACGGGRWAGRLSIDSRHAALGPPQAKHPLAGRLPHQSNNYESPGCRARAPGTGRSCCAAGCCSGRGHWLQRDDSLGGGRRRRIRVGPGTDAPGASPAVFNPHPGHPLLPLPLGARDKLLLLVRAAPSQPKPHGSPSAQAHRSTPLPPSCTSYA